MSEMTSHQFIADQYRDPTDRRNMFVDAERLIFLIRENPELTTWAAAKANSEIISELKSITNNACDQEQLKKLWIKSVFTIDKSTDWMEMCFKISNVLLEVSEWRME